MPLEASRVVELGVIYAGPGTYTILESINSMLASKRLASTHCQI
ncbi:MAG: hypothetical protein QF466_04145 [Desulfobacterales bacterium]|jgi:hypothetical protein|nr:hypothetical protein [Desulfobacterales bacterium]MDP6681867.1 hypothetical protein [Desulfobacterales bacterium]MDP6808826.1 hypothetical protein [Desulfobacterales bacterium]